MTRDVCFRSGPRSIQYSLYAPTPFSRSMLSSSFLNASRFFKASPVRTLWPSRSLGRSNGVVLFVVHTPCRSAWPHAVTGGDHLLPKGVSFRSDPVCALATISTSGHNRTTARRDRHTTDLIPPPSESRKPVPRRSEVELGSEFDEPCPENRRRAQPRGPVL